MKILRQLQLRSRLFIDIEELNKIERTDLSSIKVLDNAKYLFLLSYWTGLRYSDIARLKKENIVHVGSRIKLSTKKTSNPVVIPVFLPVKKILERRGGLPGVISNNTLNEHVKEVCRLSGIDQMIPVKEYKESMTYEVLKPKYSLVTTHTGRRSFATNL